jgi:catechol 2,3-dioxygenase-like lactoylglutathione lyase family enzyme
VRTLGAVGNKNTEFALNGVNHLALVCQDMARTVDFYTKVLGMALVKTIELPGGGQHFFFDMGNGNLLAFFWFPDGPQAAPGIASAAALPGRGDISSAVASMNHVAIDVPLDRIETYVERLRAKGVECSDVVNHDDSERGVSREMHDGVFVRSIYFQDPDGILLEFAAWTRALTPADVKHPPVSVSALNS